MMTAIEIGGNLAELDAAIDALPDQPAVFLLWAKEGEPYLSRIASRRSSPTRPIRWSLRIVR